MLSTKHESRELPKAFSGRLGAIGFFGITLLLLLIPALPKEPVLDRRTLLTGKKVRHGFLIQEVLRPGPPIDILFLGHSGVNAGIQAKVIREGLERRLRRPLVVYNLSTGGLFGARAYLFLREILRYRKVKLLFIQQNTRPQGPNFTAPDTAALFDLIHNPVLEALPLQVLTKLYFENAHHGVKLLLSPFVIRQFPSQSQWEAQRLRHRSQLEELGNWPNPRQGPGIHFNPVPVDRLVHYRGSSPLLKEGGEYPDHVWPWTWGLFRLASRYGTQIAFLQVTHPDSFRRPQHIQVPRIPPSFKEAYSAPVLAATPGDLFGDPEWLNKPQVARREIFCDGLHFSLPSGRRYSETLLPGIERIYTEYHPVVIGGAG